MPLDPASSSDSPRHSPLGGVAVALLIPHHEGGELDLPGYERQLRFLLQRGVDTFVLNGATGEYTRTTPAELRTLVALTRRLIGSKTQIVGVGSPTAAASRALTEIASNEGADGILLPMPYFFPYGQEDLASFVAAVVSECPVPAYLYNLPRFTTPLDAATSVTLINAWPTVMGIKDSGGTTDILSAVRSGTQGATCIVGSDAALQRAFSLGVCDGVVSGVCCVLPELITKLYPAMAAAPNSEESLQLNDVLMEFISWLDKFPVPWGLKIIAEARGLNTASYPMPLSPAREATRKQFIAWFEANRSGLLAVNDEVKL